MKIDGGCHCGYITYEAEADPQKPFICHCTDCQQLSGSAFRIGIRVASDDFRMLSGEPTIYAKTAESGAKSAQAFCPRCGSPIYATRFGMHRSSTASALEPSASVISLCLSSSFGHAQSCTGCLASPQFVRSRNRSGERRHDHPHELA